jgi:hypothetical protein
MSNPMTLIEREDSGAILQQEKVHLKEAASKY